MIGLPIAVLSGFGLGAVAPWIHRKASRVSGWLLALLPLGLTTYFLSLIGPVSHGVTIRSVYAWVPSLGVNFSFTVDGLGLLFALLIAGIGTLIVIYAGGYLKGDPQLGRFYSFILLFMAAMLGVVLADNLITLFVFWELTSISSFLLIGYYHKKRASRRAALQALIVTGAGGLVMLAGVVLLGAVGGSYELSELLARGETIRGDALYVLLLGLILIGAFTKSAQMPFHFWLPNAMEAPAPVSAYLHSATMVKAGVYLLARLSPILSGRLEWQVTLVAVGGITMIGGAYLAIQKTDLKRILAYSTISALGTLVMLIGLGTEGAFKAAMTFLLVHSLYKGALFMAAGAVDHETGTRDVKQLGGLRRVMPIIAVATALAAASMAGFPPWLGFIGKELIYESTLHAPFVSNLVTGAAVAGNVLMVAVGGVVAFEPFSGPPIETPKTPHGTPIQLWLGPVLLSGLGLLLGLFSGLIAEPLITPAAVASLGEETIAKLGLWHGLTPELGLSGITVALGVAVFFSRGIARRRLRRFNLSDHFGPEQLYEGGMSLMDRVAFFITTRVVQHGYLRVYLRVIVVFMVGLAGTVLLRAWPVMFSREMLSQFAARNEFHVHELVIAGIIPVAAFFAVWTRRRMVAILALGAVGYAIAIIYLIFGAPDLAMTQFAIETLTVILFVFVIYRLPRFARLTKPTSRIWDAVIAIAVGVFMSLTVLAGMIDFVPSHLLAEFITRSVPDGKGQNVVNVILVDFRGIDTLGEITVLAVAAIGVYTLMKLQLDRISAEVNQEDE